MNWLASLLLVLIAVQGLAGLLCWLWLKGFIWGVG